SETYEFTGPRFWVSSAWRVPMHAPRKRSAKTPSACFTLRRRSRGAIRLSTPCSTPPYMKKSQAPKGAVQGASAGIGASRDFLQCIAQILVGNGHFPKELIREFTEICSSLPNPRNRFDPADLQFVANL